MAPPIAKSSDSQSASTSQAPKIEQQNNLLDIAYSVKKIALAPAVNSLAIEPVNVGANVVNGVLELGTWATNKVSGANYQAPQVGKLSEMDTGTKPHEGSGAAISQQVFGTAGSFIAYAVAGKVAGKLMRAGGELMPLEMEIKNLKVGALARSVAQDRRVATVLGATAYAGLKDTKEGESHLSNAASTFIGFTAFEAGNSLFVDQRASALARTGQRFTVGAFGGYAQANTASIIQEHKFVKVDAGTMISGGVLNALMPAGHRAVDEVAARTPGSGKPYVSEVAAKLHTQAARALPEGSLPEPGSWADPKAHDAVVTAARADLQSRVQTDAPGESRINQTRNLVELNGSADPLTLIQELAHRKIFKDPVYERQFQAQAADLHSNDPLDLNNRSVKDRYIQTRVDQEVAARTAQNEAAEKLNARGSVSTDAKDILDKEGYRARFEREADDFVRTKGKSRPEIDHAEGRNFRPYDQPDGTRVSFGQDARGPLTVNFRSGRVHTVNLGEPIMEVRAAHGAHDTYNYFINGSSEPRLVVNARHNEMKVAPANGDRVLITGVDNQGAVLDFSDGTKMVLSGSGRLTVSVPGRRVQVVDLGATPARFAIVERPDGAKLFQIANEDATLKQQIKVDPTRVEGGPRRYASQGIASAVPPERPETRLPVRSRRPPPPPPLERPPSQVQGGMPGTPPEQTYYGSDFPADHIGTEDRYPLRPNIFHDPVRGALGIDQRAMPGYDMTDPQNVEIAKLELPWPLEDHFAQLGRHGDNEHWPW